MGTELKEMYLTIEDQSALADDLNIVASKFKVK